MRCPANHLAFKECAAGTDRMMFSWLFISCRNMISRNVRCKPRKTGMQRQEHVSIGRQWLRAAPPLHVPAVLWYCNVQQSHPR